MVVNVQKNGADVLQILIASAVSDGVDLLLGGVHNALGGAHFLRDDLGDVLGGLGNLTEQGFVCHNLRVLLGVGGGGGNIQNLQQVIPGFLLVIYTGLLHLIHDRNWVNVSGVVEHGVDGGEDILILL